MIWLEINLSQSSQSHSMRLSGIKSMWNHCFLLSNGNTAMWMEWNLCGITFWLSNQKTVFYVESISYGIRSADQYIPTYRRPIISSLTICVSSEKTLKYRRGYRPEGSVTAGNRQDASSFAPCLFCGWVFSRFFPHNCSCLMASDGMIGHVFFLTLQCNWYLKKNKMFGTNLSLHASRKPMSPQGIRTFGGFFIPFWQNGLDICGGRTARYFPPTFSHVNCYTYKHKRLIFTLLHSSLGSISNNNTTERCGCDVTWELGALRRLLSFFSSILLTASSNTLTFCTNTEVAAGGVQAKWRMARARQIQVSNKVSCQHVNPKRNQPRNLRWDVATKPRNLRPETAWNSAWEVITGCAFCLSFELWQQKLRICVSLCAPKFAEKRQGNQLFSELFHLRPQ